MNSDVSKLNSAQSFMAKLDNKIQDIIKFGGTDSLDFNIQATIEIVGSETIEMKSPISVDIPEEWLNIHEDGSIIREKMEGSLYRIQLYYPDDIYKIRFYTEGPRLATPHKIYIEKGYTEKDGSEATIWIKLTFQ